MSEQTLWKIVFWADIANVVILLILLAGMILGW